ncbi:LptF/LptG family permease [Pleurocapsales cyanobacterium LEGE 06147]|nr:LptF/LptG family permease [Pleurocapsales cyanobacterium LEGE 06147]
MNPSKYSVLSLLVSRLNLIDRYITIELTYFFLFSLGIFSAVGIAVGTVADLIDKVLEYNLPIPTALEVLLLKFPEFIAYALPISILLATLITYGHLGNNSELIALRSIGISVYRFVAPAIVLSLIVTTITFLFNELVVPAANYQATLIQQEFLPLEKKSWQKIDIIYPEYEGNKDSKHNNFGNKQKLKNLIYAENFDGKNLRGLIIINWRQNKLNQIIVSESAKWNGRQKIWDIFQGNIYNFSEMNGTDKIERFTHQQLTISRAPFDLISQERDPYEMNTAQAWEYLKILKFSGDEKKILMFRVRTQQKIAFPFICIIFALIGSALGASIESIGRAKSFGLCVAIAFSYYLLSFMLGALGLVSILSPFLAAWLPNFLGLGLGGWLLVKTAR